MAIMMRWRDQTPSTDRLVPSEQDPEAVFRRRSPGTENGLWVLGLQVKSVSGSGSVMSVLPIRCGPWAFFGVAAGQQPGAFDALG